MQAACGPRSPQSGLAVEARFGAWVWPELGGRGRPSAQLTGPQAPARASLSYPQTGCVQGALWPELRVPGAPGTICLKPLSVIDR